MCWSGEGGGVKNDKALWDTYFDRNLLKNLQFDRKLGGGGGGGWRLHRQYG